MTNKHDKGAIIEAMGVLKWVMDSPVYGEFSMPRQQMITRAKERLQTEVIDAPVTVKTLTQALRSGDDF